VYFSEHDTLSIEAAKKLIDSHIKLHSTIPEIALEVDLNERKLKEGFKWRYKMGLFAYLKEKRLQMARKLIEEDLDKSVKEIARFVGYTHPGNLTAPFKKKFGVTPNEMIKNLRQNNKNGNNL
jgi:AraC-like DNA-binding protein